MKDFECCLFSLNMHLNVINNMNVSNTSNEEEDGSKNVVWQKIKINLCRHAHSLLYYYCQTLGYLPSASCSSWKSRNRANCLQQQRKERQCVHSGRKKGKEREWPVVGIPGMLKLRFDYILCNTHVHCTYSMPMLIQNHLHWLLFIVIMILIK